MRKEARSSDGKSFDLLADVDVGTITVKEMNAIIRESAMDGEGLFTAALRREMKVRQLEVPFLAHDLLAEIAGKVSSIELSGL